jgi:hypothetical protein
MKAWCVQLLDYAFEIPTGYYAADTRSKSKALAMRDLIDIGLLDSWLDMRLSSRRAPEYDNLRSTPGCINGEMRSTADRTTEDMCTS